MNISTLALQLLIGVVYALEPFPTKLMLRRYLYINTVCGVVAKMFWNKLFSNILLAKQWILTVGIIILRNHLVLKSGAANNTIRFNNSNIKNTYQNWFLNCYLYLITNMATKYSNLIIQPNPDFKLNSPWSLINALLCNYTPILNNPLVSRPPTLFRIGVRLFIFMSI